MKYAALARPSLATAAALVIVAACSEPTTTTPTPDGRLLAPSLNASGASSGRYLVVFDEWTVPSDLTARVGALGGSVAASMNQIGVAVVEGLSSSAAAQLGASADVAHIGIDDVVSLDPSAGISEPEGVADDVAPMSPSAPQTAFFFPRQWHLRAISAQSAWAAGRLGSPAVRVFILDTGIDYTHRDLAGLVDLSASVSFVPPDDALLQARFPGAHPVADLHFHGTHVAATVSSNAFAAAGVTSRVTLVGVKVLGANGFSFRSSVLQGILYAADKDADVVNMSLGGGFFKPGNGASVATVQRVVNYAKDQGTLIVVAAGNESIDLDHDGNLFKTYCGAANVVCVSATGPTGPGGVNGPFNNIDAFAPYSNYGRSAISVAAPGGSFQFVWEACSRFSLQFPICGTGTFVLGANGTSMATPHVSGLAALLVETLGRNNPSAIRAALAKYADDLGAPGNDPFYGRGRINVKTALGL